MIELSAYYDVSGHSSDQPFVVVAGFVASKKKWLRFEDGWQRALRDFGLGKAFHATEIDHSGSLSRAQKDKIFQTFAKIAKRETTAAFCIGIEMQVYAEINEDYPFEEFVGTPHALAARTFVKEIRSWRATLRGKYELSIFYEEGGEHIGDMKEAFARDGLPEPTPVEKKHPSAQAADLLGWLVSFYLRNRGKIESLDVIKNRPVVFGGLYQKKDLVGMVRALKMPRREKMGLNPYVAYHTSPKRPRKRSVNRAASRS